MSTFTRGLGNPDSSGAGIAGDRRSERRYSIALKLGWKSIQRGRIVATGSGTTIDLSRTGVLFVSERPLSVRTKVELSISWPATSDNSGPLELVVTGQVVRIVGNRTAIRKTQHSFRSLNDACTSDLRGMKSSGHRF